MENKDVDVWVEDGCGGMSDIHAGDRRLWSGYPTLNHSVTILN